MVTLKFLKLYFMSIPLAKELAVSFGVFKERTVGLILIEDTEGCFGMGEI